MTIAPRPCSYLAKWTSDQLSNIASWTSTPAHVQSVCDGIKRMSHRCNLDRKHMIKTYANHVIRRHPELVTHELLTHLENVMHANECNLDHVVQYVVFTFAKCFSASQHVVP